MPPSQSDSLRPTDGPVLEIIEDNHSRIIKLDREVTRMGRSNDNDVQVPDARVSKKHAEVRRRGSHFLLVDLASKAGLFCNGIAVSEQRLTNGDQVMLGPTCTSRIVFRTEAVTKSSPLKSSLLSSLGGSRERNDLQNLARFLEFSRAISGGVSSQDILAQVVDVAVEITGADRGIVVLRHEDDRLTYNTMRDRNGEDLPLAGLQLSETIVRGVLTERKPRIVSDMGGESELAAQQSIMSLELGSAVAMPLWRFTADDEHAQVAVRSDEVFGVLYLDSRKRRKAFDNFDVGLLETLARDASSAIENARLLREAQDKQRLEQEMQTAREVQACLLPSEFWSTTECEVSGACIPCLDLGGDYLDQFRLPGDRVGLVVADVCGKGLPAALLAAALQGMLTAAFERDLPLPQILAQANRVICKLAPVGKFISVLGCILSPDGKLSYVNAGHCPLLIVDADGVHELLTGGMALGLDTDAVYEEHCRVMQADDLVVMYSDGVLEAENREHELYGDERLQAMLRVLPHGSSVDAVAAIMAATDAFRSGASVTDDVTVLVAAHRESR